MKALTLHQPWASLMAKGVKTIETRHWKTNYQGLIAIHAAKTFPAYGKEAARDQRFMLHLRDNCAGQFFEEKVIASLPLGEVVAVVELFGCIPTEAIVGLGLYKLERLFGNYGNGRFGWQTRNLRRLQTPVSCSGFQRIWNLPSDVEKKVLEQL